MTKSKDILFIADPWDTLDHERDSTLHLAAVGKALHGIRSFWATPDAVYFDGNQLTAQLSGEVDGLNLREDARARALSEFHSIHWRVDPPVTMTTLRLWLLLETAEEKIRFVNAPTALVNWNEKLSTLKYRDWAIGTLIANSENAWKTYFEAHVGRKLIAKPAADAASRGVLILPEDWAEALTALKALRADHGAYPIVQEFSPEILSLGETRAFALDGKIVGVLHKKPKPNRPIMSLDSPENSPELSLATLSAEQRKRAEKIATDLARSGAYLSTIDFIGEKLLEINVTSPGLIKWLDARAPEDQKIAPPYWAGLGF